MAAVTLIAGSLLGWIAAALALAFGALVSTAVLMFVVTTLSFSAITLCAAAPHQPNLS
ncbi:MAG: hypothetical protein ACEPO2_12485 [Pelagibaca sp.]